MPLRARADLVARRMEFQDLPCWLVKDPVSLAYHRLQPIQYSTLQLLNGARSLDEIAGALRREFPIHSFNGSDVRRLIADLHAAGLVTAIRPGLAEYLLAPTPSPCRRAVLGFMQNPLYVRLPAISPEAALRLIEPCFGWMFTGWGVCLGALLILSSWLTAAADAPRLARDLPAFHEFFSWRNMPALWLTLGMAKIAHEFGHALACRRQGGECHGIGLSFLAFCPCLYCDVTDSWMLPSKWQRLAVGAAGMYVELVISALALWLWKQTDPGQVHYLALNVFLVTSLTTILFNANPLLQFDGYYMLGDVLEIPNLRGKADRLLRRALEHTLLGRPLPPAPEMPDRRRGWLMLYALCASIYRCVVVVSMAVLACQVLKRYELATVGLALGMLPCLTMAGRGAWRGIQLLKPSGAQPMNPVRVALAGIAGAALAAAAFLLPVPARLEMPLVVEPRAVRHVYATTAGALSRIAVEPGDLVEPGQVLFELASFEQVHQQLRWQALRRSMALEVALQRKLNNAAGLRVASSWLERLDRQIADFEARSERLRIVAPCAGKVVCPPLAAAETSALGEQQPRGWAGTPLDAVNLGAWIETGTHMVSLAPTSAVDALVLIEQPRRNDLVPGSTVTLMCEAYPGKVLRGSVEALADRQLDTVPRALSSKYGGTFPTVTLPDGREQLREPVFAATVRIADDARGLLPGMRGKARFTHWGRTAAGWLAWHLHDTLKLRL